MWARVSRLKEDFQGLIMGNTVCYYVKYNLRGFRSSHGSTSIPDREVDIYLKFINSGTGIYELYVSEDLHNWNLTDVATSIKLRDYIKDIIYIKPIIPELEAIYK